MSEKPQGTFCTHRDRMLIAALMLPGVFDALGDVDVGADHRISCATEAVRRADALVGALAGIDAPVFMGTAALRERAAALLAEADAAERAR
jgi:hypothetical protein